MQKMIKRYNLREKVQGQHQTYALGIKEVVFSSLVNLLGYELHTYMCFLIFILQLELEVLYIQNKFATPPPLTNFIEP